MKVSKTKYAHIAVLLTVFIQTSVLGQINPVVQVISCGQTKVTLPDGYYWQFSPILENGVMVCGNKEEQQSFTFGISGSFNYRHKLTNGWETCGQFYVTVYDNPPRSNFNLDKTEAKVNEPVTITVTTPDEYGGASNYVVDWGDGSTTTLMSPGYSAAHSYQVGGLFTIKITGAVGGCKSISTKSVMIGALCQSYLPTAGGSFKVDNLTGNFVYVRDNCPVQAIMPCVTGQSISKNRVVKASANTFNDKWPHSALYVDNSGVSFPASKNQFPVSEFETGELGKWRLKSTYAYSAPLIAEDKNFKAGTFTLQTFNWSNEGANNNRKWLLGTQVTAYSPQGDALSEKNILGIESAAKFGYKGAVPYLTAKNASYTSVLFESFENLYQSTRLEDRMLKPSIGSRDNISLDNSHDSHSGYCSWRLPSGGSFDLSEFKLTQAQLATGLQVRMWVKVGNLSSYNSLASNLVVKVKGQSLTPIPVSVVARTGNWILCEAYIRSFGTVVAGQNFSLTLQYTLSETIWFDDIRVQPADSEMSCYVYDPSNLRVVAVFDDQHFGLYYQYNGEGKLVRKMRETERGVKTIQETQYNTKLR